MKQTRILFGLLIALLILIGSYNIYLDRISIKHEHVIRMDIKKLDSIMASNNAEMNAKLSKISGRLDSLRNYKD